jgi:hypothetical protein
VEGQFPQCPANLSCSVFFTCRHDAAWMITSIKPELRSMRLDRRQCCWHVSYRFCGLSTEIIVHAENEAEARAKARWRTHSRRPGRRMRGTGLLECRDIKHVCALDCEGIVSKRLVRAIAPVARIVGSKSRNPTAPAVTREAEEEWN